RAGRRDGRPDSSVLSSTVREGGSSAGTGTGTARAGLAGTGTGTGTDTGIASGISRGEDVAHGTRLPWPHSQKTSVPAWLSGRLWRLWHCLQVNAIMPPSDRRSIVAVSLSRGGPGRNGW